MVGRPGEAVYRVNLEIHIGKREWMEKSSKIKMATQVQGIPVTSWHLISPLMAGGIRILSPGLLWWRSG